MNLVKRVAIDSVYNTTVLTKDSLFEIYGDVFTGIGEYKKPNHIEVDSSIPPVITLSRFQLKLSNEDRGSIEQMSKDV